MAIYQIDPEDSLQRCPIDVADADMLLSVAESNPIEAIARQWPQFWKTRRIVPKGDVLVSLVRAYSRYKVRGFVS
jgi:hypothetical protein